jgi:hypothetical protein
LASADHGCYRSEILDAGAAVPQVVKSRPAQGSSYSNVKSGEGRDLSESQLAARNQVLNTQAFVLLDLAEPWPPILSSYTIDLTAIILTRS